MASISQVQHPSLVLLRKREN